jgi:hypothetical protein
MGIGGAVWLNYRCCTGIFLQGQRKKIVENLSHDVWAKI